MANDEAVDRAARIDELTKQADWMEARVRALPVGDPFSPGIMAAVNALRDSIAHYEAGGPVDVERVTS
jgi:hypothetical protein